MSWAVARPRIVQNTSRTQTIRRMNLRTDTTTHPSFDFTGNPGQVHCPASQPTVSGVTIRVLERHWGGTLFLVLGANPRP